MIKAASWRPVLFYPVPFSGKRLFYGLFFFLVTHMDGLPGKSYRIYIIIVELKDMFLESRSCFSRRKIMLPVLTG